MEKPDCYSCVYRASIPGDAHSRCIKVNATVKGNPVGIKNGWFYWPVNYDPTWLVSCDEYREKK